MKISLSCIFIIKFNTKYATKQKIKRQYNNSMTCIVIRNILMCNVVAKTISSVKEYSKHPKESAKRLSTSEIWRSKEAERLREDTNVESQKPLNKSNPTYFYFDFKSYCFLNKLRSVGRVKAQYVYVSPNNLVIVGYPQFKA